jgi:hypothetical protein
MAVIDNTDNPATGTDTEVPQTEVTADECYDKLNRMVELLEKIATVLGVK